MQVGCVRVSWGFVLLAAVLFYLDDSGLFFWLCLAALVHESGHILFTLLLGGRISSVVLGGFGFSMYTSGLTYGGEILATLMGPIFSLGFALLAASLAHLYPPLYRFAGLSLTLGVFNLLPAFALDGGRIIRLLLLWQGWEEAAQKAGAAGTFLCALLLAYGAAFYNPAFWLGLLGIILTAIQERKPCLQT